MAFKDASIVMPILFIAPLPPPVHGQAVACAYLLSALRERGFPVSAVNEGPAGRRGTGAIYHRLKAVVVAVSWLLEDAIRGRSSAVYISVNANWGMLVTVFLAALARFTGHTLTLHHNTAAHIDRPRALMRLVAYSAGPKATHLCTCRYMTTKLKETYAPHLVKAEVLSNIVTLPALPAIADAHARNRSLTLGHLSNLSFEKGVREAVNTLHELRRRGLDARLLLAGPASTASVAKFVADTVREFSPHIQYRGPVYNTAKECFFSDIDVFLFPTTYPNETQGIVNLEALRYGVPVIAYARCCIADDIDDKAGLAVPLKSAFAPTAADWILAHLADAHSRQKVASRAQQRFAELHALGKSDLENLLNQLTSTIARPGL